jgi:hypothetical protein
MAKAAGVMPWQVSQVWQASDLKPFRLQPFKISRGGEDPNPGIGKYPASVTLEARTGGALYP